VGGLQADIANPVKMFKSHTLQETIEFARMQEDQMNRAKPFLLSQTKATPRGENSPPIDSMQPISFQGLMCPYVQQKNYHGKQCKSEGRRAFVSIAMNDSH